MYFATFVVSCSPTQNSSSPTYFDMNLGDQDKSWTPHELNITLNSFVFGLKVKWRQWSSERLSCGESTGITLTESLITFSPVSSVFLRFHLPYHYIAVCDELVRNNVIKIWEWLFHRKYSRVQIIDPNSKTILVFHSLFYLLSTICFKTRY